MLTMETDFPEGETAVLTVELESPRELTLALRRPYWVGERFAVKINGESVPEDVIRRRFSRGWANFDELYRPLADVWQLYNCSGPTPVLMAEGERE